MIDKETAYAMFREEAHRVVKKGTPHVEEIGRENDEYFYATIVAFEAVKGDDNYLNDPGTQVMLIRKQDGKAVRMYPQDAAWTRLYRSMTPVNYLAA